MYKAQLDRAARANAKRAMPRVGGEVSRVQERVAAANTATSGERAHVAIHKCKRPGMNECNSAQSPTP